MSETAANSGETAGRVMPIGRRFEPGKSGNPAGRPKGVAKAFRDAIGDPAELARVLMAAAHDPALKPLERIAAVRELLDRGYGKAPAFAAIEGQDPLQVDDLTQEIAEVAAQLLAHRERAA